MGDPNEVFRRCERTSSSGWRCSEKAISGGSSCEKHYLHSLQYSRKRIRENASSPWGSSELTQSRRKRKRLHNTQEISENGVNCGSNVQANEVNLDGERMDIRYVGEERHDDDDAEQPPMSQHCVDVCEEEDLVGSSAGVCENDAVGLPTDAAEDEYFETARPRKRGRPKGCKDKKKRVRRSRAGLLMDSGDTGEGGIETLKKCGRPKRSKNKVESTELESKIDASDIETPKTRGRPKGSKNKIKRTVWSSNEGAGDIETSKKRGRPKGSKNKMKSVIWVSNEGAGDIETPKKRGRPKGSKNKMKSIVYASKAGASKTETFKKSTVKRGRTLSSKNKKKIAEQIKQEMAVEVKWDRQIVRPNVDEIDGRTSAEASSRFDIDQQEEKHEKLRTFRSKRPKIKHFKLREDEGEPANVMKKSRRQRSNNKLGQHFQNKQRIRFGRRIQTIRTRSSARLRKLSNHGLESSGSSIQNRSGGRLRKFPNDGLDSSGLMVRSS